MTPDFARKSVLRNHKLAQLEGLSKVGRWGDYGRGLGEGDASKSWKKMDLIISFMIILSILWIHNLTSRHTSNYVGGAAVFFRPRGRREDGIMTVALSVCVPLSWGERGEGATTTQTHAWNWRTRLTWLIILIILVNLIILPYFFGGLIIFLDMRSWVWCNF